MEGDPLAEALAWSIGLIVSGLVAWKVATVAFKVAQLALNGVIAIFNALMAMNPIMLVVLAITALIAVIILLWANWEGITKFFKETIDKLVQWFVDLGTKIGEALVIYSVTLGITLRISLVLADKYLWVL